MAEETSFTLTLDVDTQGQPLVLNGDARLLVDLPGVRVEALDDGVRGHGFGIAESITVLVTIGTGVASELAAEAIRDGVKAIIRRVRSERVELDGSLESLRRVVESERVEQPQ